MVRTIISAVFALFAVTAVVWAQTDSPNSPSPGRTPETVIVTGTKPSDTMDQIVSQFVDVHAATDRKTGQMVRDVDSGICPFTAGLPPALNAFVTARIVAVAKLSGARVQAAGSCRPNIEVLFSADPQALVDSLVTQTHGAILGVHYVHETDRLSRMRRPIQSWYITATRRLSASSDSTSTSQGTEASVGKYAPDDAYRVAPERHVLGSKLDSRIQSEIVNALIVADTNRLAGHDIGPVADYIAMLALSQPKDPDGCNDLPSILDLMSAGCGDRQKPKALTDSDMAYLKALYAADLGAMRRQEEDSVTNGMKNNLAPH
jgi:hypothetical protein